MGTDFLQSELSHILIFQAIVLVIILSNAWLMRACRHEPPADLPRVSILVPARNEEGNIRACIRSLLAQDYPNFEVIALDDQSSDATPAILQELKAEYPNMKLVTGVPSPDPRIVGKNWACAQLARRASSDLLLFTDADTQHHPNTLRVLASALAGEQADLLTGFPRQHMRTWGERLLVPFFGWASLCFTPLWLAYRLRMPVLANAVGQMLLFRREAYQAVGGHAALGASIVDDLELAQRIKAAGLRWRLINASDLIACRMYSGGREAYEGFSKNYFAAFGFRLLPYLFIFGWLLFMFWLPLLTLVAATEPPAVAFTCIGLSLLVWLVPYAQLRIPPALALLYPVTILANTVVALRSLWLSLTGGIIWKDRPFARQRWRWL